MSQSVFIHTLCHCRVHLKVCMLAFCRKILCREFYHIIEAGGTYVDFGDAKRNGFAEVFVRNTAAAVKKQAL